MAVPRKRFCEEAGIALQEWARDPIPEKAYGVLVAYGQLYFYEVPMQESPPREVFVSGLQELANEMQRLTVRAVELAGKVGNMESDDFTDRVDSLMYSLHKVMGAWGYAFYHHSPEKLEVESRYAALGSINTRYQELIETLKTEKLTPVLAASSRVLHEIGSSLPRTSTAKNWCYLRLVEDARKAQAKEYEHFL